MKSSYDRNYRQVGDIRFSADLAYGSRILHAAFCKLRLHTNYRVRCRLNFNSLKVFKKVLNSQLFLKKLYLQFESMRRKS